VGYYDDDAQMHVWDMVDNTLAEMNEQMGVWIYKGYRVVNGIYERLYYLPAIMV